ncbi:MAG: hypothetical protein COY40_05235 [Alphaproteobacteria bacterium CG_4_10_14_0_8_um_filter_53_9]|nr:MAG: hypothetical protein COY40_05235 [Alphaproteobacteria bacterium CG_4_10_14_0_8_um_filter_53_9]
MKKTLILSVLALGLMASPMVTAQSKEGDTYWQNITSLGLSANAQREVMPDRVSANLNIEERAPTAKEAQSKVNTKAQALKTSADKIKSVKLTSSNYNVYRVNDGWTWENGKRIKKGKEEWQATQTFTLDSADKDALIKLAGSLQDQDVNLQGFTFYLSRAAMDSIKEELVTEAVNSLQSQAKKLATQLGMSKVRMASVNIGSSGGESPRPMMIKSARMEMMASDSAMAAPVAEAGEQTVSVNVTAEVHLSR